MTFERFRCHECGVVFGPSGYLKHIRLGVASVYWACYGGQWAEAAG